MDSYWIRSLSVHFLVFGAAMAGMLSAPLQFQGKPTGGKKGASQMMFVELEKFARSEVAPIQAAVAPPILEKFAPEEGLPVLPAKPKVRVKPKVLAKVLPTELPTRLASTAPLRDLSTPPAESDSAETSDSLPTTQSAGAASTPAAAGDSPGNSQDNWGNAEKSNALAEYLNRVSERIKAHLQYPLTLRRLGITGKVDLRITILDDGRVSLLDIAAPSGKPQLDQIAANAVRQAQPFERFDPRFGRDLNVRIPVDFRLLK